MSDDEQPLSSLFSTPNGAAVNGKVNGHAARDIDMSDDDEDEMPLSQSTRTPESLPPRLLKRKKAAYAESSSSDDDTPLASSPAKQSVSAAVAMPGAMEATTVPITNGKPKGAKIKEETTTDDDDDKPIAKSNGRSKKPPRKKVKKEDDDKASPSSDDEMPAPKKTVARKRKPKKESDRESSDDDKKPPPKKPRSKKPVKDEESPPAATPKARKKSVKGKDEEPDASPTKGKGRGKKKKDDDEEQGEVYRWWDQQDANNDGSIKWKTLEHNGVIFPPPYEPLPSNIKMKYNGQEVSLPPASEEIAGFYAALLETDHAKDTVFNANFFRDFKDVLARHPPHHGLKIDSFELCDFRPMYEYFEEQKAKRKAMTAAEKKEIKKAKDEMEAKYMYCLLDGRKEKVGNFRVEPPGLFRGRGEHPRKGSLKYRVRPEDITLNIGKEAPIPVPNMPGQWKAIQHDNTVTWLANWTENINGSHKYVFLAAGSSLKGQSDMMKFEKARELKNHVDRIRMNYTQDLKSKVMAIRQRATAMYFIDRLALRAGNEKGEDEADTVGCCSLRCEHLTLQVNDNGEHEIVFDFLGKDSIRYYNTVIVDPQIFKNVRIFKQGKDDDDNLFDRVNTTTLNKHLTSEMKGLTAKVFRTYNASSTFQSLLDETPLEGATLQEKLAAYNAANRKVAILCNHQRAAPKTHDQSMLKMRDRLRGFKYERMKLRHMLFHMDSRYKRDKRYAQDESDIDDDWIATYEDQMKQTLIEKAQKKFAKDNEKLKQDGERELKPSVLEARIEAIEEDYRRLVKERGTNKSLGKKDKPVDKIEAEIEKLAEKIKAFKLQIVDRDEGKEVALGTSKINYLDPRITAAWCEKYDVPIEKLFSKTLMTKFPWAMEVDEDWKF